MDTVHKELILQAFKNSATAIDRIGFVLSDNSVYFQDEVFEETAGSKTSGYLSVPALTYIDFENSNNTTIGIGTDYLADTSITIIGIGVYSSAAQTLTQGSTYTVANAVAYFDLSSDIILSPGEVMRIKSMALTVYTPGVTE